jgi:hypothetical protein
MSDDNAASRDVLWKMYQEHCTQGRHHESQRSTVISAVMAISAAVIGLVTFDKSIAGAADVPLAFLLIVLGAFGGGFAMKHYERFSLHMERARRHRDALDALLPGQPLRQLKQQADSAHNSQFPHLHKWRLHYWWLTLNLILAVVGVVLLVVAVWFPVRSVP